jgi:HEAT repeat protein
MVPIGASRRRLAGAPALVLSAALLGGCASGGAAGPAGNAPVPEAATTPTTPAAAPLESKDEVTRALLLLLADRRLFEPVTMEQAFSGGPDLRVELATALGRIGDPRGRVYLEQMLASPEPAVRRAAVFALGELGRRETARTLLVAARDRDRETGVLAVEALGKLGVSVIEMGDALEPLGEEEAWARLLPHLFRFDEEAAVPLAIDGLGSTDPALHARAAYALGRHPRPEGAAALRGLLADADPFVRGWAARGLGEVGGAADLTRLAPLLSDPEPGPVIEALRSGRRLVLAGATAAPDGWRPRLLELLSDPRPQVRLTAVEAASAWMTDRTAPRCPLP